MTRRYVRDKNGRFASTGASKGGRSSAPKTRKPGPTQEKIAKLESRIKRQEQFVRRMGVGKFSASEIRIEKQELQRLRSSVAGLKARGGR